MTWNASMGPVLLGYGFVVLGVLIAAYSTRRGGLLRASSSAGNAFGAMFITGLWVGLILGGLGSIFYVSPLTGVLTLSILIAARLAMIRKRKNQR
ncbi:MAG: hypothetical protein WHX93_12310 [bacterium]